MYIPKDYLCDNIGRVFLKEKNRQMKSTRLYVLKMVKI